MHLRGGGIKVDIHFENDNSSPLYERIHNCAIGRSKVKGVKAKDIEYFVVGLLLQCYEDVMEKRYIDYDDGNGKLYPWASYLAVNFDQNNEQ